MNEVQGQSSKFHQLLRSMLAKHGDIDISIRIPSVVICDHCSGENSIKELTESLPEECSRCKWCGESVTKGVWFYNPEGDWNGYLSISDTLENLIKREDNR